MPTQRQLDAASLYGGLMEEVKLRIAAIDLATVGATKLPAFIAQDHCFLQLRMICELIALGCLTAHGDIEPAQKKLRKEWAADRIMNEMERLHPDFFPVPVKSEPDGSGKVYTISPTNNPFTKADLVKIYGECGDRLHRGSIKRLHKAQAAGGLRPIENREITALAQKLNDLLAEHVVVTVGANVVFMCLLRVSALGGRTQVSIAERYM